MVRYEEILSLIPTPEDVSADGLMPKVICKYGKTDYCPDFDFAARGGWRGCIPCDMGNSAAFERRRKGHTE